MAVWVVVDSVEVEVEDSACHSPSKAVASRMALDAEDEGVDEEEDVAEEAPRSFVNSLDGEDEHAGEVALAVEAEAEQEKEVGSCRAEEEKSCPAGEGGLEARRWDCQTDPEDRGDWAAWGAGLSAAAAELEVVAMPKMLILVVEVVAAPAAGYCWSWL